MTMPGPPPRPYMLETKAHCPECGMQIVGGVQLGHTAPRPSAGDAGTCGRCGTLLKFTAEGSLERMTIEDLFKLPLKQQLEVVIAHHGEMLNIQARRKT